MVNYEDGIVINKNVFSDDENKMIRQAKAESERLDKLQKELTEVNKAFDDVITAVRNFGIEHKLKDVISKPIQIEIQKQRDQYINQVKEQLLKTE